VNKITFLIYYYSVKDDELINNLFNKLFMILNFT
jgi:hypothetical protein